MSDEQGSPGKSLNPRNALGGSPFVGVPEIAAFVQVPVSRIYEWTRQIGEDTIPCYRAGKRLVFAPAEVLDWFTRTQRHNLNGPMRVLSRAAFHGSRRRARMPNRKSKDRGQASD